MLYILIKLLHLKVLLLIFYSTENEKWLFKLSLEYVLIKEQIALSVCTALCVRWQAETTTHTTLNFFM